MVIAAKTGFTSPSMPGMPAPMQPMGGLPPMGGPGTFPVAPNVLPAGQTFTPPSMPPMPLAGMPPPPMRPPMAQQGSNANRRRKFGDSLESMLGRNQGLGATAPQRRPLPMPQQQQRMVAPGIPMMRTPTPRPMEMGGEVDIFGYEDGGPVQYMDGGGAAKPNMREFMDATGATSAQASQALYGSVGSNEDIRNWDAIMASDNPLQATQAATSQMYGSGSAIAGDQRFYDDGGNYNPTAAGYGGVDVGASTGGPKLEISGGQVYITSSDGLPLTGLSAANAASFGITQDQINAAIEAGGNISGDVSNAGYVPYDAGNLLMNYSGSGYNPNSGGSSGSNNAGSNNAGSGSSGSDNAGSGSNQVPVVRQTGDVGSFSRGLEGAALYGPSIDTAPVFSQYVQNPTTGAITTTAGPTMTSVSPIGSIDLPAAPVDIDIYDYLSDPVFGSMDTPIEKNMGGAVPMQTSIAGQPHMLSYINQDEEALLRSFGGSGIAGPGGIPSYPPSEYSARQGSGYTTGTGSSNFDSGYKPSSGKESLGRRIAREKREALDKIAAAERDAEAAAVAAQQTPSGKMDFGDDEDYTPTSAALDQQLSGIGATNITTNFSPVDYTTTGSNNNYNTAAQADRDLSGFDYVAAGGLGSGNVGVSYTPERISLGSDDPVVFTDVMGRTYNNAADRDRANLGYQQESYQQGNYPIRLTSSKYRDFGDFDSNEEANRAAAGAYFDDPNYVPPSNYNLQNTPDIFSNMFNQPIMPPISPPKIGGGDDKDDSDQDRASKYDSLLALERDFAPGEGGYSLVDLKERISLAEGTSDAGGYGRLLGGQETKNFKIDPTKMTVQEILDFQNKRGEGTYAEYSKGINKNLGKLNDDGTDGVISTPVGKYQIVGSTLKGLIREGVLDPDELFNENAQERAGTHLITEDLAGGKGLRDLKTGDMTLGEFETALGKQFEGIKRGLDDVIKEADEGETSDIQLESGAGTEINIFDPDNKKIVPPKTGDSDEDEITVTTLSKPAEKVEQITSYTDKDGKTTVDDPDTTDINEAVVAQLGLGSSLADVTATGRDIGVPNAAESAFLMEALNEMEFDDKGKLVGAEPNFFEETVGKIIKNLTLGAFDPNDPQKGEDAKAILDAYQKTGKFVYDGKEMSVSEIAKRLKEQGEKGLEPAVTGVRDKEGNVVGFEDGTGFRNIMGDYDYEKGIGSDTQNILTGDTDVFGGNTNTNNTATAITTGGGDDSGGSDGGSDTDVDTGHTTDKDGNKVCNTEGYIYNPETKICEKKKVEEEDKDLSINVVRGEDFDDVLSRVTTAAPNIGSIAGNVKPMQEGGMVGLNRAADNFLQALAG